MKPHFKRARVSSLLNNQIPLKTVENAQVISIHIDCERLQLATEEQEIPSLVVDAIQHDASKDVGSVLGSSSLT